MGSALSHCPVGPHWSLAGPLSTKPCSQENAQLAPGWKLPEALGGQLTWPLSGLDGALHWEAETPKRGQDTLAGPEGPAWAEWTQCIGQGHTGGLRLLVTPGQPAVALTKGRAGGPEQDRLL